eukprot:TRINITY_DN19930_c0_g1_i1.p1 TRINITY_DN19930_c0_g1~~TRINITY_DN19930_c0_g1_i1.p1  ORF type:complete len:1027 (+),score=175.78 TRINITY_DN19930_c0_g1_i1:55-3135(+)
MALIASTSEGITIGVRGVVEPSATGFAWNSLATRSLYSQAQLRTDIPLTFVDCPSEEEEEGELRPDCLLSFDGGESKRQRVLGIGELRVTEALPSSPPPAFAESDDGEVSVPSEHAGDGHCEDDVDDCRRELKVLAAKSSSTCTENCAHGDGVNRWAIGGHNATSEIVQRFDEGKQGGCSKFELCRRNFKVTDGQSQARLGEVKEVSSDDGEVEWDAQEEVAQVDVDSDENEQQRESCEIESPHIASLCNGDATRQSDFPGCDLATSGAVNENALSEDESEQRQRKQSSHQKAERDEMEEQHTREGVIVDEAAKQAKDLSKTQPVRTAFTRPRAFLRSRSSLRVAGSFNGSHPRRGRAKPPKPCAMLEIEEEFGKWRRLLGPTIMKRFSLVSRRGRSQGSETNSGSDDWDHRRSRSRSSIRSLASWSPPRTFESRVEDCRSALARRDHHSDKSSLVALADHGDGRRASGEASRKIAARSPKYELEVYVGGLPSSAQCKDVKDAFVDHLRALPDYQAKYSKDFEPVTRVSSQRQAPALGRQTFLFVAFADATLSSTAVAMTGLRVCGRSVKVNRPAERPVSEPSAAPLDIRPLRAAARLPFKSFPGAQMLNEVWVGTLTSGFNFGDGQHLLRELNGALLAVPAVKKHFPEMEQFVISAQLIGDYAFAETSNEILASTLVAMAEVALPCGARVRTGWPAGAIDAETRAPQPLCFTQTEESNGIDELADGEARAGLRKEHDMVACEVYIGNVGSCEPSVVEQAIVNLLTALPSYQANYAEDFKPIVYVKTGRGKFAFARAATPEVASTLVALGVVRVQDTLMYLRRPMAYAARAGEPTPPLEMPKVAGQSGSDACEGSAAGALVAFSAANSGLGDSSRLWIGNLWLWPEEAIHLEEHLSKLAVSMPSYHAEMGPPLRGGVRLHNSGRFAFVTTRDASLAKELMPVWHGTWFHGRQLAVNTARERLSSWASWVESCRQEAGFKGSARGCQHGGEVTWEGGIGRASTEFSDLDLDPDGSISDCTEEEKEEP